MKFWGTRRQSPMDSFWNTLTVWHWLRSCEGHQGFWAGTQQNDWHHAATQPLWMWTLQSSKKHHSTDTEQYWGRKLCVLCESIWEAWGLNLQNKLSQLSHRETWKNQSPKKCHQWSSVIISDHQWSSVISDEYTIFLNKWYIYIYISDISGSHQQLVATRAPRCLGDSWTSSCRSPRSRTAPLRSVEDFTVVQRGISSSGIDVNDTSVEGTERDWNTHQTWIQTWIKHESNTWNY